MALSTWMELKACLMAGKWVLDLFRSLASSGMFLHFGSTSAGWGTRWCDHPIFRAARSVFQLLHLLWPGVVKPRYVAGHKGDPGNECVDVLSGHAAQNAFYE